MVDNEPLSYLLSGTPKWARDLVRRWASDRKAFALFLDGYSSKIKGKLKGAGTDEDLNDVLGELEIAYRILADDRMRLTYEPVIGAGGRSPDFQANSVHLPRYFAEVKRIREPATLMQFEECIQRISTELGKIPSNLGFFVDSVGLDMALDLGKRLDSDLSSVVGQCAALVRRCMSKLDDEEKATFPVEGFEDELSITILKMSQKPRTSPTSYLGGGSPLPYTQRESFKFTDLMTSSLGQLVPNEINLLIMRSHSSTHEPEEIPGAIYELKKNAAQKDNDYFRKKGLEGADDFLKRLSHLSAIVFVGKWTRIGVPGRKNYVWRNPTPTADLPLDLEAFLAFF
ncbi:hypothetical protein ACFLU6_01995 [Acidobacteriota bacterium]